MKTEYTRKPARNVQPGDRIFSVATRQPIEVATVFVKAVNRLIIETVDGKSTMFNRKELVLVAKDSA